MSALAPPVAGADLHRRIGDRTAVVGVVGLGYVGLPLALTFAERQFRVLGFDVDPAKVETLSRGEMYIKHLDGRRVAAAMASELFRPTDDFARLGGAGRPGDLRAHAADSAARARLEPRRRHRATDPRPPATGPARRARVDHLSGNDR